MMPPVVAFVVAAVQVVGSVLGAISAFTVAGIAVGRILLTVGINLIISALFKPKQSVAERQAQTLELSIGEVPREAIFGRAATGGALLDGWNDGHDASITNLFETMVIRIADHECDAIEGYWINDKYYPLLNQGAQTNPDLLDKKGQVRLWIETRLGKPGQTVSQIILDQGVTAGEFLSTDTFTGLCYVVARYEIGGLAFTAGRPKFTWLVRGKKCYDPRLDSTVAGGSGPQRWSDPTTFVWSENARICHANYIWGAWNYAASPAQLMVGPGKSFAEAPAEAVIADANLCDEAVALKAGGSEPRYRIGGVIKANEAWIDIEDHFAAAMGGQLVERAGSLGVDPGVAKSTVFEFTDDDLKSGKEIAYQAKVGRDKLINTVTAKYVAPDQLWSEASAAMRRSLTDITTDGEAREIVINLVLVTSETQAQRCAEIVRRKARLQPSGVVPLGPKYMQIEDGDWGGWTSARRFGGARRVFEVQGINLDEMCDNTLAIKEIASSVFTWDEMVDELDKLSPAYLPSAAPPSAQVDDFAAVPYEIAIGGNSSGGILATWTPTSDPTIVAIKLEYRPKGSTASAFILADPTDGSKLIDVLALVNVDYEVRATPVCVPSRDTLTTAWIDVLLSAPFTPPVPPAHFQGYQTGGDLIRFTWDQTLDTTLQYEIRVGGTFALGRFVARVYGGAVNVSWPILAGDDLTFWIKTLHASGIYSDDAAFWVAVTNTPNANIVVAEDFTAAHYPGVVHRMNEQTISPYDVLALDQISGVSVARGDYYASFALGATFTARTWIETTAFEFAAGVATDPAGLAVLDAFISVNEALPTDMIEGFTFENTTTGAKAATTPATATGITYSAARSANGVVVATALIYNITFTQAFSEMFEQRLGTKPTTDKTLIQMTDGGSSFLRLIWRDADQVFVLEGNFAPELTFALPWDAGDTLSVGMWQTTTDRGATLASKRHATPLVAETPLI